VTASTIDLEALARRDVHHEVRGLARWYHPPADLAALEANLAAALWQAVSERAQLHLRALAEFLSNPRPKATAHPKYVEELVADHYFDTKGAWVGVKREALLVDPPLDDLNKHLAHLTTRRHSRRVGPDPFGWESAKPVGLKVLQRFRDFVDALDDTRSQWFAPTIAAIDDPWRA
jgi:hypothetical protein